MEVVEVFFSLCFLEPLKKKDIVLCGSLKWVGGAVLFLSRLS